MPRKATKKKAAPSKRSPKTTRKKQTKKRVIKKVVKIKNTPKKPAKPKKRSQNKRVNKTKKKVIKKIAKSLVRKKTTKTSLIFYSCKPASKKNLVKTQKIHVSPYVLDLKKVETEKNINVHDENSFAQIISNELLQKIGKEKTNIQDRSLKKFKVQVPNIKLPRLNLSLPKINLPEIHIPQLNVPKLKLPEIKIGKFNFSPYWQKAFLTFAIFSLIFILPFAAYDYYLGLEGRKNNVLAKTTEAIKHLTTFQKAASAQDLYYAQYELEQASSNFNQAKNELDNISILTKTIIKIIPQANKQYSTAQSLISVGEKLSKSGAVLTQALENLDLNSSIDSLDLTNKLIYLKDSLNLILPDIKQANIDLHNIYLEEIPQEYHDKVVIMQNLLPLLEKNVESFVDTSDLFLNLLGNESKKRYLLLFQNNSEIRPTGGFIGSFALIDIDQGNIEKIDIPGGGPYDMKAGLKVSIESPQPLHLINHRWELQDSNWFADLPASAEKIIWFYEKSGGPTVDGLILVNATFLESILSITGPIEMPEYNKTITQSNFFKEIQKNVELEYDKEENKPKQIIADLTPKIIDSLLKSGKDDFIKMFEVLIAALNEKEIQFYFTNYSLEKLVLKNNWGGQLINTDQDYLNIVSTNIAGEKTDAKIEQDAKLNVDISPDGTIINTLTINKSHLGQKGEQFYGVPNLDYLRIYVPKGSSLLEAQGFDTIPKELFMILNPEIYQKDPEIAFIEMTKKIHPESQTEIFTETDKTVFANWLRVEPGESKKVVLKYQLPFKLNMEKKDKSTNYLSLIKNELKLDNLNDDYEKYSLVWQKQSGKKKYNISLNINLPDLLSHQFIYPEDLKQSNNVFDFQGILNTDKFFAIVYNQ
jgi:uncharacterized protein DUF4012